jgi:hypothetical protein
VRRGNNVFVGHNGAIHGYTALILFSVSKQVGVIALTNGPLPPDAIAVEVLDRLVSMPAPEQQAQPRRPGPTPNEWRRFMGHYHALAAGGNASVECHDGVLQFRAWTPPGAPPLPPARLRPTADPSVFTVLNGPSAGEPLTFHVAADGSVAGLARSGAFLDRS